MYVQSIPPTVLRTTVLPPRLAACKTADLFNLRALTGEQQPSLILFTLENPLWFAKEKPRLLPFLYAPKIRNNLLGAYSSCSPNQSRSPHTSNSKIHPGESSLPCEPALFAALHSHNWVVSICKLFQHPPPGGPRGLNY